MQLKVLVVHNLQGLKRGSFVFTQDIPESMSVDWIFRKSCLALFSYVTCGKFAV